MRLLENYTELELKEQEIEKRKNAVLGQHPEIFEAIAKLETEARDIAKQKSEMKEKIKAAMEKKDIKKFENDYVVFTYIAPTQRKGVDMDKLKSEYEEIYIDCLKVTDVKSSVRIKVKEVA